jgi:hypothetical protein
VRSSSVPSLIKVLYLFTIMGAWCCCCCGRDSLRSEYQQLPDDNVDLGAAAARTAQIYPQLAHQQSSSRGAQSHQVQLAKLPPFPTTTIESKTNGDEAYLSPRTMVDLTKPAFAGLVVDQKYATYGYYDKKFIWIGNDCKTLHMSQYTNKINHHKEASLENIVSIESTYPLKYKMQDPQVEKKISPHDDIYLTIKFGKGGAIDLRFQNSSEKNEFMKYLQIATSMAKHPNNQP